MEIPAGTSPQMMVYQALQLASSQDTVKLKQAEVKLAEWETEPGFYTTLHGVFSDPAADVNVRWMAAVYFKNGIDKYWRKNAKHELSATEKTALRAALISKFDEPVQQIAVQIAALIAKIARFDCPRDWPEIIPTLIEAIQVTGQQQQQRSLMVLQHVVKALSSKRLYADRKTFYQLTATIYTFLLNLWDGFTTLYFQAVRDRQPPATCVEYAEKAILALRVLRKLTIYGFTKPHKSEQCMLFIRSIFTRLRESLECRLLVRQAGHEQLADLTEKFILKQMKILNEFVDQHAVSFVEFIPMALEFGFNFVFNEGTTMIFENNDITFPTFAIHCINLMKGLLTCTAYNKRSPRLLGVGNSDDEAAAATAMADGASCVSEATGEPDVVWAQRARKEFFTPVRLNYICDKVIMHYFLLTPQDLAEWDDDPEAFASDEGGESWKYALRPCTETFFLALFNQFRADMTPELLSYIHKAQQIELTAASDLKTILTKDAIYNAAGIASFTMFDEVDFDEWFSKGLSAELRLGGMNFRIVRRRVILLVGQWAGSKTLRPQVYAACLHLLGAQEDMCVRLAACKTLMTAIDDFEFEQESFVEFLEPSIQLLFALLQTTKECDTKMNVLGIMSFVIDRMSDKIESHADSLIQYLPRLWEESNTRDHNMLRCAIISTLVQIVKASTEMPPAFTAFLYPVIGMSTNKDEPSHVYLLEEGLELWLAVVENSATMTAELLELSTNLLTIIENTSENLRTSLCIITMYVVLNPAMFLYRHGKQLVKSCQYLLSDMRSEGIVMVMKLYEECLRCKPDMALELLRPALPGIFRKVAENAEYPMVMTMYLAIVARLLILDQNAFGAVLQEVQTQSPQQQQQQQQQQSGDSGCSPAGGSGQFLDTILDVWIAKMSLVTQPEKRKLLSLALTSLLTAQNNSIYERFSGIMYAVCETLNDIMKDDDDTSVWVDSLVYTEVAQMDSFVQDIEVNTHHYDRKRQLCLSDPVHTIELRKYLQSQLDTMRGQLGVERFNALLATLSKPVLVNLGDFVQM